MGVNIVKVTTSSFAIRLCFVFIVYYPIYHHVIDMFNQNGELNMQIIDDDNTYCLEFSFDCMFATSLQECIFQLTNAGAFSGVHWEMCDDTVSLKSCFVYFGFNIAFSTV